MNRLLHVDPDDPDPAAIGEAAKLLARGRLLVLPTDTVYGLAADPRAPGAVEALYRIKNRPADKPLARLAYDERQVTSRGARLDAMGRRLAAYFWPGPLTLVLPTPEGRQGFRVPDHSVCLAILREAGTPLAVTSANPSGSPPAITARAALDGLGPRVDLALDTGPAPGGVPSSVVLVEGEHIEILREGAISVAELERVARGSTT